VRLAALYDIHGNLPALEAVLDDIRREQVEHIVVGGDVLPGPMPRETLTSLLELDIPVRFIRGNGEVAVLAQMAGRDPGVPEQAREAVRWTAEQLHPEDQRILASWPKTVRFQIGGLGEILFCHATPRDENECFTRLTPEDRLLPVFAGLDLPLVVCGHSHMQFDRMIGPTRVVNAGSVGMPFGKPGAGWLLLGPQIELRHTPYNLTEAAERIAATSYPQAHDFATRYVLDPPLEEEMLEVFTKAELK
jgi:diadenosine tetraphosphatase ApaH/serine/threonine PP2A family protein phosphatase